VRRTVTFIAVLAGLACLRAEVATAQATRREASRPTPSRAPATAPAEPGSELTIWLLTAGVGEEVWEKFGHNAIWIHDASSGTDSVFHWGLFDFRQPHFIPRFLQGRMLYSMGGFLLQNTLEDYRYLDRTVWAQRLELTPAQRLQIRDFIRWNEQPQNRNYLYNYFVDNCSTRVRDILDRALGGAFQVAKQTQSKYSYRDEAVRLTQEDFPLATGMDIGLGRPSDHRMTTWEEMFLPMALHDFAKKVVVHDASGGRIPLVSKEVVLYVSRTHQEPDSPPRWAARYLVIGMVTALVLAVLGFPAVRARERGGMAAPAMAGVVFSAFALVLGVLALLLSLLWGVTNHTFAHRNENLLLFNPVWLVLIVSAPMLLARGRATWSSTLAWIGVVSAVVGLLLHAIGLSRQDNLPLFALALPPITVFALVLQRARTVRGARRDS